jgi:hypothetical protein
MGEKSLRAINWMRLIYRICKELKKLNAKNLKMTQAPVAHACNPSYLGG